MENVNNSASSKRMLGLWLGILMTLVSIVLYIVGAVTGVRGSLWIAAIVIGGLAAVLHAIVGHSTMGGTRMTAMACLVTQAVFITIMATCMALATDTVPMAY